MQYRPKKKFGQNFLQDPFTISKIMRAFSAKNTDHIVEIGPGLGALTKELLACGATVNAIEIDEDVVSQLQALDAPKSRFNLLHADALTFDFSSLGNPIRIIGNLPYNVATAIILKLLHFCNYIADMQFMLQKEVVSRLVAEPGSRAYGRLSIIVQYFCKVEYLFDVPPDAFFPQPKVTSALLKITPYQVVPYTPVSFIKFEKLLNIAFSMKRKTVWNNLKKICTQEDLMAVGIDCLKRPEQIDIESYARLCCRLS